MLLFKKLLLVMIIAACLSFFAGCGQSVETTVEEKVIELSMPDEEGVYIEKIGDGSMIMVRLNTDYGFEDYLKVGAGNIQEQMDYFKTADIDFFEKFMNLKRPYCTTFTAQNESGDFIFGRNLDNFPKDTGLLLYTKPKDGYASVSMTDGVYFGYENENSNLDEIKRYMRAAAFYPCDGMNEHGVVVATNSVPSKTKNDSGRVTIGSIQATRLILDYARNVDEAVDLLGKYNIFFEMPEQECHYLISDALGKSVIVEFIKEEMRVVESDNSWQVNTNFAISNFEKGEDAFGACPRYRDVFKALKERNGVLKGEEPMELLQKVDQDITLYSAIYNSTTGEVKVAMNKNYDRIYKFKMEMKK